MSLQYRAIWQDDSDTLLDTGRSYFQDWLTNKGVDLILREEGIEESDTDIVYVDPVADNDVQALRIRLVEKRQYKASGRQRWTTAALWMTDGTNGWTWIDVRMSSDNISDSPSIYPPGLVRTLLTTRQSRLDNLGPDPINVSTERDIDGLLERLYDPKRTVPVILFSVDNSIQISLFDRRVIETARRLAGCADVRRLTRETQHLFHDLIETESLSVFGGAVRIYLPIRDKYEPQPWKHRYIRRLPVDPEKAADLVVNRVLPRVIIQEPPSIYRTHIRALLATRRRDYKETAEDLFEEAGKLADEIDKLSIDNENLESELRKARELQDEAEAQAEDFERKNRYLREKLRVLGEEPVYIEQQVIVPRSIKEAIDIAMETFDDVVIHPEAPRDITRLDNHTRSSIWGRKIYGYLESLNAYSAANYDGDFWLWNRQPGHDYSIPSNVIASGESETVRNNSKLIADRLFPIDQAVDSSGRIRMESHLKVDRGGGISIPRIYFCDDTKGNTGKVHVGFVGPHSEVPNKSKN